MTRTDVHAPSSPAFDPEAYRYLGTFEGSNGDNAFDGYLQANIQERNRLVADLVSKGYGFGHGSSNQCGHCGARMLTAALLVRDDVKQFIFVGENCLDGRFEMTASEFQSLRTARRLNADRMTRHERIEAMLEEHPWLADLEDAIEDDYVIADLHWKFRRDGSLTEGQLAYAQTRLVNVWQRRDRAARFEAEKAALIEAGVEAPEGRVVVEGVIVATREYEGDYGLTFKMLVKTDAGWKVWCTIPRSIDGWKGDRVRFTATLTRAEDDPTFARGSRPTKAETLSTEQREEVPA